MPSPPYSSQSNDRPSLLFQRLPPLSRMPPRRSEPETIRHDSQNVCEFCMNVGHDISSCRDERIIFILNNTKERARMIIRPISPNNLQENPTQTHWSSYSLNANNLYLYFYNMPIANLKLLADRNGIPLNQTASNLSLSLSNKMINDLLLEERMEQSELNTNQNYQLSSRRNDMTLLEQIENDLTDDDEDADGDEDGDEDDDEDEVADDDEVETRFPILSRFRYQHLEGPVCISPILLIDVFYNPIHEGEAPSLNVEPTPPKQIETEPKNVQDCPICLDDKCLDKFITTNCNHVFCEECVETLLKSKTLKLIQHPQRGILVAKIKCPMCRTHVNTFIVRKKTLLHKFRSLKDNAKNI
jgi:hypothetical protein